MTLRNVDKGSEQEPRPKGEQPEVQQPKNLGPCPPVETSNEEEDPERFDGQG